jgi:hypothetical protein
LSQTFRVRRFAQIGTGDFELQIAKHLGDAAHANPADTDKMHAPDTITH